MSPFQGWNSRKHSFHSGCWAILSFEPPPGLQILLSPWLVFSRSSRIPLQTIFVETPKNSHRCFVAKPSAPTDLHAIKCLLCCSLSVIRSVIFSSLKLTGDFFFNLVTVGNQLKRHEDVFSCLLFTRLKINKIYQHFTSFTKHRFTFFSSSLYGSGIVFVNNYPYFCSCFREYESVSKKSIAILSFDRNSPSFTRRDEHLCFRLSVYAIYQ